MRPQGFRALGPFVVNGGRNDGRSSGQALPGQRGCREAGAERGARVGGTDAGDHGRPQVLRSARFVAAHDAAADVVRRVCLRRGARLRRVVDPRLAGDRGVGHAADAGSGERDSRPVHRGADPLAHYAIDSAEGHWNSGTPGLGYTVRPKEGYFPPAPHDTLHDLRTRMVLTLERLGIPCEFHHHEVASGGQCEIDLRYGTLTRMADQVMTYKHVVKNVAREAGKCATFMPKPLFGDNGSGMHTHQSLWKEGTPLMADKSGYAGLSQLARSYLAGLLDHAPALLAFCAPTTNSYRRLVPGYEAPVNLVYSQRNRSSCIRIPMYSESPKAKRIEFRCPDAAANPYLAFAAMLMAGID